MYTMYIWHKLISVSAIVVLSLISWLVFPADQLARWELLLAAILILGYSHYIIGGIYQTRSFARKARPWRWHGWFWGLTIVSILMAVSFIAQGLAPLLAFIVIGYFMAHGFFNEITLFERQTSTTANYWLISSIILALSAVILNAVGHSSWFFASDLTFSQPTTEFIQHYLTTNTIAVIARIGAIILIVGAVVVQSYAAWEAQWRLPHVLVLFSIIGVTIFTFLWHPFHYLFFFGALLLYHFVVWFIFFLQQFIQRNRSELPAYLGLHLLIIVPFISVWLELPGATWIETYLLNIDTFITFTLIHISVSFLSEPWFARWCRLT